VAELGKLAHQSPTLEGSLSFESVTCERAKRGKCPVVMSTDRIWTPLWSVRMPRISTLKPILETVHAGLANVPVADTIELRVKAWPFEKLSPRNSQK
jgi:hypothetical protein